MYISGWCISRLLNKRRNDIRKKLYKINSQKAVEKLYSELLYFEQLKGLNQAKIVKKSVILFWLLNNSRFLISAMHVQNKKYASFVSVSSLTGECAAQKLKTFAVLVYGHVYIIWSY